MARELVDTDSDEPQTAVAAPADGSPAVRVNWKWGIGLTVLGLAALVPAALLEEFSEGFWTGLLVEIGAAIFLATGLALAGRQVLRDVNAQVEKVRVAVERLERGEREPDDLAAARREAQTAHSTTASHLAALGRATSVRDFSLDRLNRVLDAIEREVTSPAVGLAAHRRDEAEVHLWHPSNFGKGDIGGDPTPPCADGAATSDAGRELIVTPHGEPRVEWTASFAARVCPDGVIHYAVGHAIEAVNPQGRDSDKVTLRFMNEQIDRRLGFRQRRSVHVDDDDHDAAVGELIAEFKDRFQECLGYFYDLKKWTDEFEEYGWYVRT